MTDRIRGFVVVLDHNLREDDAQPILDAIRQIKGVIGVKPVINNASDEITELRVRTEYFKRLCEIVHP